MIAPKFPGWSSLIQTQKVSALKTSDDTRTKMKKSFKSKLMHSGLSLTGMGSGLWLMIWSMDHEIVWLDNLMRFLMKVKYWLSTDRHVHRNTLESDVGDSVTIFGILIFSLGLLYLLTVVFGKRLSISKAPVKKTKKVDGGENH